MTKSQRTQRSKRQGRRHPKARERSKRPLIIVPRREDRIKPTVTPSPFNYNGGRLLNQVEVHTIFWGMNWLSNPDPVYGSMALTPDAQLINQFFADICTSRASATGQVSGYLSGLIEYSDPAYPISGFGQW